MDFYWLSVRNEWLSKPDGLAFTCRNNQDIRQKLDASRDTMDSYTSVVDESEASTVLSSYTTDIIKHTLDNLGNLKEKTDLVNKIVNVLAEYAEDDAVLDNEIYEKDDKTEVLNAVVNKNPLVRIQKEPERPETSISRSSLFTGAPNEPNLQSEFRKEIATSDRIDMLGSFIKWSGIVLILDALKEFTARGGRLRIITTTYMGATDAKAILELSKLPNTEIKISYDTKRTRLHAKTYVFYRDTGFTTAYVGSSNLSNATMSSGLEWNMKITEKDLSDTFKKIDASFTGYWNMNEFETFTADDYVRLKEALDAERYHDNPSLNLTYNFTIRPYSYQQEVLDQLEAERELRGYYRNLVVARLLGTVQ